MLGSRSGFIKLAKEKNPAIIGSLYDPQASFSFENFLSTNLNCSLKVVNFVKSSALNSNVLEALCNDISAEHKS